MGSVKRPPIFPQRLKKQEEKACFQKLIDLLEQMGINLPLIDFLLGIPSYTKYIKGIVSNK